MPDDNERRSPRDEEFEELSGEPTRDADQPEPARPSRREREFEELSGEPPREDDEPDEPDPGGD